MGSYDEVYNNFKWDVPEYYNFAFDVIDKWAEKKPQKVALMTIDSESSARKHTFSDLSILSNKFANVLKKEGIKKGDFIIVMLPKIPEWYIAVLGIIKVGAVFIPATTLCVENDIKYRINKADVTAIITDEQDTQKVDNVGKECPSLKKKIVVGGKKDGWVSFEESMKQSSEKLDKSSIEKTKSSDPLLIYFTSGTESYPKMVLQTQAYAIGHIVTAKFCQDLREDDIHWTLADTGWAKTAWGKLFGQWVIGCTIVQDNIPGKFNSKSILKMIGNFGITTFCAPPTAYRMMILENLKEYNYGRLRHCMSAGEPLNPEVIDAWKEATGLEIYDYYGQSESVCLVSNYRCMPIRSGSMGKPTPGHIVSIIDDDGNELSTGEEGHIGVKTEPEWPPGLFKGYYKDPDKDKQVFRNGWYYTGDKAYKDEDGYLWFVGRSDDVIKASGYRIGPFEVESALIEHPAVAEAAVIGHPDPIRGMVVKAFVVLVPGYTASDGLTKEIQEHVKKVTAPYKYPRIIEYVKKFPKTISGKIKRAELRKMDMAKNKG